MRISIPLQASSLSRSGQSSRRADDLLIAHWLLVIAALVLGAVVIGGLTRLTESGLSITDWRPLTGWLPPFGEAEWHAVFERYRKIPEYTRLNAGMSLEAFKGIFWLEYIHRLWGRLIGLVFALPFVWFVVTGKVDRSLGLVLTGLFLLGGAQGGVGWYMVQSGLSERTDVSQYRLALHLGVALLIYILVLRTAFWLRNGRPVRDKGRVRAGHAGGLWLLLALVVLTILSGAFVAGLNAGTTYNTFPLMDGDLMPSGMYDLEPAWLSAFEDVTTVQFNHRVLAVSTVAVAVGLWLVRLRSPREIAKGRVATQVHAIVASVAVAQAVLGIAALVSAVRIDLAVAHQGVAFVLVTVVLWGLDRLERERL